MHLSYACGGPHEEGGRWPRTVRSKEVSPLDACAVEVLAHELGLSVATVKELLGCLIQGMFNDIQRLASNRSGVNSKHGEARISHYHT